MRYLVRNIENFFLLTVPSIALRSSSGFAVTVAQRSTGNACLPQGRGKWTLLQYYAKEFWRQVVMTEGRGGCFVVDRATL